MRYTSVDLYVLQCVLLQNDNRKALTILYQGFVYRIQYHLIKSLQRKWLQIFSNLGIKSQPLFKQNYLTPVINSVYQDILSIGHAFPPIEHSWFCCFVFVFCLLFLLFSTCINMLNFFFKCNKNQKIAPILKL